MSQLLRQGRAHLLAQTVATSLDAQGAPVFSASRPDSPSLLRRALLKYSTGCHGGNASDNECPRHIKWVVYAHKYSCPGDGQPQQQDGNGCVARTILRNER